MTATVHHGAHLAASVGSHGSTIVPAHRHEAPVAPADARPYRTVAALQARLVRRSTMILVVAGAAYMSLEVVSYRTAYPDGVSPLQFTMFEDNPAIRMMSGVPVGLDTAGGFAVWDGGWMMQLILAVWAVLTASRLLRGEEDLERTDLVLSAPVRATRATGLALVVLAAASVLIGSAVTVTMLVCGTGTRGSVLLGLALAGVTATFAGVAAVTSQLVDVRRRAAAVAAGVIGISYVLRMVGNSTDARSWVRWLTPLGWMDELTPYGDPDLRALVPLLVVPVALAAVAVVLRARRDTGGAIFGLESGREPHLRLLGSPIAFGWRTNRAVLLGWAVGLGIYSAVMGALIATMIDWLERDESYQQIMASLGLDMALTTLGFLAWLGSMFGVAVGLQVAWRIGAAWGEEESGRAEQVLARRVSRLRWLGGHASLALLGGVALLLVSGTALWLGALASGSEEITWEASTKSVLNTLPVVVLVGGVALATFGLLPRLTVAVPVALTVVAYVLALLGPALKWPSWVLDLSPFTHLAWVPAVPWAATSGIVMACLGLLLATVGLLAFRRRDLVGS